MTTTDQSSCGRLWHPKGANRGKRLVENSCRRNRSREGEREKENRNEKELSHLVSEHGLNLVSCDLP